ncbi:DUF4190 domain-containing protein [Cellulomonas sp. H30R-01]|nr:DUF4190 domain-containing protein [Cellulomonas sp. H30R-01]
MNEPLGRGDDYPEPYYAAGWEDAPARREPLAGWALAAGVLLLAPLALVLGIVALRRTSAHGTRGRGMAVAAIVLGALGTLGVVVAVVVGLVTAQTTRPLPGDVGSARDAHAVQLVTGTCVEQLPADGSVDVVRVVPCAQPHEAQVVTEYDFAENAVWPGQQAADARVAKACVLDDAETAAGVRPVTWAPTEQGWSRGDRRGLCLAVVDGGGVTGSFLDGSATLP